MKQIKIEDYHIIHGVPRVMIPSDRCAIDTEFSGMDKKKLHRPTGIFACATFYAGGKDVWIVEDVRDLAEAFQNAEQAGWIFHNSKFDIFHLRRFVAIPTRMKMWDTMLVEQVMYSGLYDEFNLAACVRRHLDTLMEKEVREEFENHSGEMTPSQVEYACKDAIATYQLFQHQRSNIDADDLKIWKEVELPFLWALLSVGGITLDQEKWLAIAKENGEKADAIQSRYGKEVPKISAKTGLPLKSTIFEGINLASPKQVKEEFSRLGFKLEGTGEEFVSVLVDKCDFARELLEFRTLSRRAGTYGESYISDHVEADGKIYTDYFQIGAITGRMSSRSPNLQNQPREGGYRDCYVAEDGNELVIADCIAQEPKFAAFLTQDENLIDALNSKEKLYIRIARDALGIEVKKGDELYNHVKSTILGLFYGMSAKGLADRIGKTEEEAQEMINAVFAAYPKLGQWIKDSQSHFVEYCTTVTGRKVWLNQYTSAWRRLILNAPIQGCISGDSKIFVRGVGMIRVDEAYELSKLSPTCVWDGEEFTQCYITYSGEKLYNEVEMYNGNYVGCSDEHKFATVNTAGSSSWRTLREFTKQMYIKTTKEVPNWEYSQDFLYVETTAHNANRTGLEILSKRELGILMGRLASDGYLRLNHSIQLLVAEHESDLVKLLVPIMSKLGKVTEYEKEWQNNQIQWVRSYSVSNKVAVTQAGEKDVKSFIPKFVLADKITLKWYLSGVFDGDGGVTPDGICLTFGDNERKNSLATEIYNALLLFGIIPTIKHYSYESGDCIHLYIPKRFSSDFRDKVGFLSSEKKIKLDGLIGKGFIRDYGKIYGTAQRVRNVIETQSPVQMYDIVNTSRGQFMVNGMITHNSAAEAIKLSAVTLMKNWHGTMPQVSALRLMVHDELCCEVAKDDVENFSQVLTDAMISASESLHQGIRAGVELGHGSAWSAKI